LSASGLLQLKDVEAEPVKKEEKQVEKPAVQVQAHTRRASGLSSRARTATAPRNTEPSEDDLYSMPMDQLKEMARRKAQQ
jgi:hypothetical protein